VSFRKQRQLLRLVVVAAACTFPGGAQCAQTAAATPGGSFGKIAGVVRDENGTAVESTVFIASNGSRLHATTAPDGSFEFSNLKTGKYTICARATGRNAKPQDDPFVDSCLWQDRNALKVILAPGQNQSGITVPLKHGYLLKIRINDPGGQIPLPVGKLAGNHLSLNVVAPSGLMQQVPILSQDASGREHGIVIPYETLRSQFHIGAEGRQRT
jgi:hypothetical protein